MGWTRKSGRGARDRSRPKLELLESRQLLSTTQVLPASGSNLNADGSTNFDQIIGASATRAQFNVDGTGQSVAVIDTGVNYNNVALGGGLGAGHKVIAGVDFTGSPNGVLPTWQHGTGVAGVIAGNDSTYQGVAPGADIVALRVFNDSNAGNFTEIADALDWVIQHHGDYNITAVNLSIADGGNYTYNEFANDGGVGQQITQAITQLDQLNIPVVIAAGNSFDGKTQDLSFPAIIPSSVSVTATGANNLLASDAQRLGSAKGGASAVKLAAPGVGITGPADGNNLAIDSGTSFATPQVTGSIVLLQQMYENAYHTLPTVAQLDQLLQAGAVTVHDSVTGINVGRLDVLNSAQILEQQILAQNGSGSTGSGSVGSTSNGSGSGNQTPTQPVTTTTPPPTPPAVPQTEVILNGVSIGNYSTAQLAAKYANLFAFFKGPVPTLRIWAPAGSNLNLGPSTPSGLTTAPIPTHKATVRIQGTKHHATSVGKAVPVAHKTAAHKSSNLFSSLFHF